MNLYFSQHKKHVTLKMSMYAIFALLAASFFWVKLTAASAQTSPTRPTSNKPLNEDIDANGDLRRMTDSYKALISYQSILEVSESGNGRETRHTRCSLSFQRPNLASIETRDDQGKSVIAAVSDGVNFYATSLRNRSLYFKSAAPEGERAINRAIRLGGVTALSAVTLMPGNESLTSLVPKSATDLAVKGTGSVGGVAVDLVESRRTTPKGDVLTTTYAVGREDHLLRQFTVVRTAPDGTVPLRRIETYTNVRANIPLPPSAFVFTPPAGMKATDSWDEVSGTVMNPRDRAPAAGAASAPTLPAASAGDGLDSAAGIVVTAAAVAPAAPGAAAVKVETTNLAVYDFGTVSPLDRNTADTAEQIFLIKNAGARPIRLQRMQASCGCLSAVVTSHGKTNAARRPLEPLVPTRSPAENRMKLQRAAALTAPQTLPLTLGPGQEITVRTRVDLAQVSAGPLHKIVSLYAEGYERPVARLEMTGTMVAPVTFRPAALDFGRIATGQPHRLLLSATFDPRVTRDGKTPLDLVSSNPLVTVMPVQETGPPNGGSSPPPSAAGNVSRQAQATLSPLERQYEVVVLADAPIGTILATLGLKFPENDPARTDLSQYLARISLGVVAQVDGDIAAQPQVVAFGAVKKGSAATRRIALRGAGAKTLQEAQIRGSLPSSVLSARLLPDADTVRASGNAPDTRFLEIAIGPDAKAGVLRAQIMVTLKNGQRLSLPVSALIQP